METFGLLLAFDSTSQGKGGACDHPGAPSSDALCSHEHGLRGHTCLIKEVLNSRTTSALPLFTQFSPQLLENERKLTTHLLLSLSTVTGQHS